MDDDNRCPMTPEQAKTLLENQEKLMEQMATMQKYLFAGRVAVATIICLGLTVDWMREHASILRLWIFGK